MNSRSNFKLVSKVATEHQEQAAFMSWLARFYPKLYEMAYHIPNGRMTAKEGSKYKRLGAKSGVPDVCIAFPIKPYHGLYIEFKRVNGGSGTSDNQDVWLERLTERGYLAVVANGWEEGKKIVERYICGERNKEIDEIIETDY